MGNPGGVRHIPVLVKEVIDYLKVGPGKKYIDTTVGGGGHTEAILAQGGEVLGIDQDPNSLEMAEKRLLTCPGAQSFLHPQRCFKLVRGNFANLQQIASENDFRPVDGILMDLGFASFQMEDARYGLSFTREGPLDMRLDPNLGVTARDLVNTLPEEQLYGLFRIFGEEPKAREIAREIVRTRKSKPFETTRDLAGLVKRAARGRQGKIHPATRIFQALRIAINSEIANLEAALPQAFDLLNDNGRLVVISFHSGDDRIVKIFFKGLEKEGVAKVLTKKPVLPSLDEISNNPRSRSAKLRVLTKNAKNQYSSDEEK